MEMRVRWEEMFGHLWCIMLYSWEYALITSICSWHMQHPVRYYLYYSVPRYSWHRDRVHVHTWRTAARDLWEDCYIVTTMNTYWNYHALRLFRYLCFMCLYVFVCVQPAVLGGRGRIYIIQCFQRAARFHIFVRRYFIFTMIVRSDQQGYSRNL